MKDKQINMGSYSLISTIKSGALIICGCIIFYFYLGEKQSRVEQENLNKDSNSELIKWKNKDLLNL